MKKVLFFVFVIVFAFQLSAQISMKEATTKMSKGLNNSFTIELPTNDKKMVKDVWTKMMKDYKGKTKFDKKANEFFTDNAKIDELSENTVDVYAQIVDNKLTVWYDLGGAYLSSDMHDNKIKDVENIFGKYHFDLSRAMAVADLKTQEKTLSSFKGELKKLEKENQNLQESIEKAKKAIAEAEAKIRENLNYQENKKVQISEQGEVVVKAQNHLATFETKKSKR